MEGRRWFHLRVQTSQEGECAYSMQQLSYLSDIWKKQKMVKNNNPDMCQIENMDWLFLEEFQWQFFTAARLMLLLSHWSWEKTEAKMQEANTGAKWQICLSR